MRYNKGNDDATDGADAQYGCPRFRDDCGRQAEKEAEEKTNQPAGPAEADHANDETDGKAVEEGRGKSCTLVRKRHRSHHADGKRAEPYTAGDAEGYGGQGRLLLSSGLTTSASAAGHAKAVADQIQRYPAAAEALTPCQQQALVRQRPRGILSLRERTSWKGLCATSLRQFTSTMTSG